MTACVTLAVEDILSADSALSKGLDVLVEYLSILVVNSQIVKHSLDIVNRLGEELESSMAELKVSTTENTEFLLEAAFSFCAMTLFAMQKVAKIDSSKPVESCLTVVELADAIKAEGMRERAVYLLKLIVKVTQRNDNIDTVLPQELEQRVLELIS